MQVDLLTGQKDPFQTLMEACKKVDRANIHYISQILSSVLDHTNTTIRHGVIKVLFTAEKNGKLSAESKENLLEYQRQYLEKKLVYFGVRLHSLLQWGNNLVVYKGELHGKQGVERVLCQTQTLNTLNDLFDHGKCTDDFTFQWTVDVLRSLTDGEVKSDHIVNMLVHDNSGRCKFYLTDQDWTLPNLSKFLLSDLGNERQAIRLKHKVDFIKKIIDATLFSHTKKVLLRSFTAESFLVKRCGADFRVIFWNIGAACHATYDIANNLHFVGKNSTIFFSNFMHI